MGLGGFGTRIFNLLTQEGSFEHGSKPGRASIGHVNHGLRRLRHALEKEQVTSLALPRLATGVGGLSWDEVKPLIANHLGDLGIHMFIYAEYHPGVQAKEPGI